MLLEIHVKSTGVEDWMKRWEAKTEDDWSAGMGGNIRRLALVQSPRPRLVD